MRAEGLYAAVGDVAWTVLFINADSARRKNNTNENSCK